MTETLCTQTITFGGAPTVVVGGAGTVTATGGASGNPVTFTSTTSAVCTATGTNGSTVTGVTAGTCTIAANQAGNTNWNAAAQVTQNIAINKASQSITFGGAPTVVVGGTGTVTATGGASGNPVTFTSTTTGVCTVSGTNGSTVTGVTVGSCTIAANQALSTNYNAAPQVTQTFSIGKGSQTITFGAQGGQTYSSGGTFAISPVATTTSGLPIAYTSTTLGVCTIAGTTVTIVTAGTCTIAANQAGDTNWNAAAQVTQNLAINKANQTITFGGVPTVVVGGTGTVTATGGASGNPVTFTSTTTGVCTATGTNGATITGVTAGTCTIAANQALSTNYNAAPQVTQTFSVGKGSQIITFGAQGGQTYSSGGTFAISPVATTTSGLPIAYTSTTLGVCTIAGTTVTIVTAGTCTIAANQGGNTNWNAATQVTQNIAINAMLNQTITFGAQGAQTYSSGGTFAISPVATTTSGLPIAYTSTTLGVCTIAGTTVTIVTAGTCTIAADQALSTNYNAAPQVTQTFSVGKGSQIITFGGAPTVVMGGTGTVTATGGASGNPVTFTSTTPAVCTTSGTNGATITGVTAGSCTIAADQAGNTNYNAATQATQTFSIGAAMPTVTTNAATGVTAWAAQLNGTVSSNGASTTAYFEYGLTNLYGSTISADQSPLGAGASTASVSALLDGLNCASTFHFRAVAINSAGLVNGADQTITTGACTSPFPANACLATRYGGNPGCTANDVGLTSIAVATTIPPQPTSCISGTPVTLDLDMTVNFGSASRYDVGIFVANDGKSPIVLPTSGGASTCNVDVLPTVAVPPSTEVFPNLDGGATGDTCGDGGAGLIKIHRMTGVTIPCFASPTSAGKLYVPYAVSWDQQASPIGGLCTSNQYPVPGGPSKCNAPASAVSIDVVVLPKINKTHSGATFNSGDGITYSITVFNDSGGTLLPSTLTDPAVSGLTVTAVACTIAANGSTCPTTDQSLIQGLGIVIPSANLPNNSSLTFTVTGTLSGNTSDIINNTATITIGSSNKSSTDGVTLGSASGAKSFAPSSITEGNNSVLTITFTNPAGMPAISNSIGFTDTYPSGLVNAASPATSTTCGGTVDASVTNQLGFAGGSLAPGASCTVSVTVTSATPNSYVNSVTFSSGIVGSTSATLSVSAALVGRFNACNVATAPNAGCTAATTPSTSRLGTKLAGTAFNLDLVALNANTSRNTSYANTVVVELLDASNNTGSFDAYNCRSTWTTVIATLSSNPAFSSGDTGLKTVGPFTVNNAYKDVRVRITQNGSSTIKGCSTDDFAIRPSAVTLVTTANAATFPLASATPTFVAGANFTLYATTAAGTNYTGTLTQDATKLTAQTTSQDATQQSGGTVGSLSSPATLTANSVLSANASYSEAGYLYLGAGAFRDDSYTAVDQPSDCISVTSLSTNPPIPDHLSDVPINGKYGCSVGNKSTVSLGRFIPDHFETVVTGPMTCSGLTFATACPVVGNYLVYSGQPFTTMVTAYRIGGTGATGVTTNYAGSFAKDVTLTAWDALGSTTLQNPPASGGALTVNTITSASLSFTAGVATTTTPIYTFTATPTAPTNIYIRADDTDAVSSLRSPSSSSVEGGLKVVSGRMHLLNAYGSELLPIRVPVLVEYWSEAGSNFRWQVNSADSITSLNAVNVAVANTIVPTFVSSSQTTPVSSLLVNSGQATMILTRPLCPGTCPPGIFDLAFNLGVGVTTGPDTSCNGTHPASTFSNQPWLRFGWCGGNHDPNARIKFGSAKSPFIYLRERY